MTAKQAYKSKRAEINNLLKALDIAMSKHAVEFQKNDMNEYYVIDLKVVETHLSELIKTFTSLLNLKS